MKGLAHDKPELALARVLAGLFAGKRMLVAKGDGRQTAVERGDGARQAAAAYLLLSPTDVQLYELTDPANPLRGYLLGRAGTPNHQAEGLVVELIDAYQVDGAESHRYLAARGRVARFLTWQLSVGIMSVPGGPRNAGEPVSEAVPVSHAQWWLNAFLELRWFARQARDPELLDLTGRLLGQLLALAIVSRSPQDRWLACGPRANRGATGYNSALDGLLQVALSLPGAARAAASAAPASGAANLDLLSVRVAAALVAAGDDLGNPPRRPEEVEPGDLPVTVDPMAVGRRDGEVAAWLAAGPINKVDPGPQQWARARADGWESFGVDPRAGTGKGFVPCQPGERPLGHPALETWERTWSTRKRAPGPFPSGWADMPEAHFETPSRTGAGPTVVDLPTRLREMVEHQQISLDEALARARRNYPAWAARWPARDAGEGIPH